MVGYISITRAGYFLTPRWLPEGSYKKESVDSVSFFASILLSLRLYGCFFGIELLVFSKY